jgi:ABC-2 type transport system permease protein
VIVPELTGTVALVRLILRRDRVRIAVWILGIVLLVVSTAGSVEGLYPTQTDLDEAAATSEDNVAAIVFNGPAQALDTVGGQVAFQVGSFGLVMAALMSLFMVGRNTRAEEESGRTEMVRAAAVGRYAPAVAALLVVAGMNLVVGMAVALSLIGMDLPTTGSLVFGAGFVAVGLVFIGVALVAAQVSENTRVVYGIGGTVIGAAFVLRAAGDVGDGTLSWLSPIGWAQKARPYAGEQWWPLLLPLGCVAALVVVAAILASHRDLAGGLVQPRPGPPVAGRSLAHPLGLALRLQRGSLIAWACGLFVLGISYGSIADEIEDFLDDNQTMEDMFASAGGSVTDSFLAISLGMLALIGTGYAIQSSQRLRTEETGLRVEPVLATPVPRWRWAASHLVMAFAGSVVVIAAAGLGMGIAYGLSIGDLGEVPRLLGAALVQAPAMWVLVGFTVALFGLAPRAVLATWAALVACFTVGLLADVLDLPGWVLDISPFEHTPQVPAAGFDLVPVVVLTVIAAGLTAAGLAGLRRRDVA